MLSPTTDPVTSPAKQCACGHPIATHDVISARFCAATAAHNLSRACICK
jgi:hypothetical protein